MIPKSGKSPADSRKSVGIHEFAALARSSLNGISQAVRDHVTKPTSLAQGRVAHLIEWKGWPKPPDPPPNAHAHFSSYCHLTEGEKEARFAAGVAEQFAIAEAKLRAWASTEEEEEEEEEDSTDEDPLPVGKARSFAQHSDAATSGLVPGAPLQSERSAGEAAPPRCSLGSGSSSFLSAPHASLTGSSALPNTCTNAPQGEEEEEEEVEEEVHQGHREQPAPLLEQRGEVCVHHKPEWRTRARSSRFDSCCSTSESPGEEEEEEEDGSVFQDGRAWRCSQRSFFSDRASSGVASFDEEEERDEAGDGEKEFLM